MRTWKNTIWSNRRKEKRERERKRDRDIDRDRKRKRGGPSPSEEVVSRLWPERQGGHSWCEGPEMGERRPGLFQGWRGVVTGWTHAAQRRKERKEEKWKEESGKERRKGRK